MANVPIQNLRIQIIYLTEDNSLNVSLAGGIFIQILNPITMQMNRPLFYLNFKQTNKIYQPISGKIFQELSGDLHPSSIGKIGLVTTSLGLNNLTVFSDPTQFIFTDIVDLHVSSVLPNQQPLIGENKEPGSIFSDRLNRSKDVGPYGQLLELQPLIAGFDLKNKLSNSVLTPNREWLYLQQTNIKRIKKLRLLDLTLVLINAHFEIASQEGLSTSQVLALERSLKQFLASFGIINICECLLKIVLARNLQITAPESVYYGTLQTSQEAVVNGQLNPVTIKGLRKIENRPELKVFAQKLLDRLAREVRKNSEVSNVYYNNLMERMLETTESTSADTMWHVLLKYFHSLFGVVRNERISFFRKERRFCCFIRQKMELLRRFLMIKYEELEQVNLEPVSKRPYVSEGFEWMTTPIITTTTSTDASPQIDRFSQETTKTLMFHMISTIAKVQTLMELFERLGIEGSDITIKLCLTNSKVAEQIRNIILSQFRAGDSYLEQLQITVPEVVSYPDIIFHNWEQKPEAEQLKMDLRQAVTILNEEQLNKIINRFKTTQNGYDRIIELLLYRLEKIDEYLFSLGQRDIRMNTFIRDSITTSATNMQIDLKELRRQETIGCIKKLLRDMLKQIKFQHKEEDLRCLGIVFKRIKQFVDVSRRADQTRIRFENQKPVSSSYTKLDSIVRALLQEYFVPRMESFYKDKQVSQQSTSLSPFDQFIAGSMLGQSTHLQTRFL